MDKNNGMVSIQQSELDRLTNLENVCYDLMDVLGEMVGRPHLVNVRATLEDFMGDENTSTAVGIILLDSCHHTFDQYAIRDLENEHSTRMTECPTVVSAMLCGRNSDMRVEIESIYKKLFSVYNRRPRDGVEHIPVGTTVVTQQ